MNNAELIAALRKCASAEMCKSDEELPPCPFCEADTCSYEDIMRRAADALEKLNGIIDVFVKEDAE